MKPHTEIFSDLIKENAGLRSENERLAAENRRLFEQADALQAEIHLRQEIISGYQQVLAERTEALEAIIDRYEVANMLAGDDPVIEKAKSLL